MIVTESELAELEALAQRSACGCALAYSTRDAVPKLIAMVREKEKECQDRHDEFIRVYSEHCDLKEDNERLRTALERAVLALQSDKKLLELADKLGIEGLLHGKSLVDKDKQ